MITNNQKGLNFEKLCYYKLQQIGFSNLQFTKHVDNGGDIVGTYNGTRYVFQCKDESTKSGNKGVQAVVAARPLYKAARCAVISTSGFTSAAIELAKANNCILLLSSDFFKLDDFPPTNYSAILESEVTISDFNYNLFEDYDKVKRSLGRTPKWDELNKHLRYVIVKEHKNYGNFLAAIGDKKCSAKPSDEELKKEYMRVKNDIGKKPTLEDMKKHSSFARNSFQQYPFSKLQRECGDRPNVERGVTKEQLVEAYFALQKKLGHPPKIKEIDEHGKYSAQQYRNKWGSINAFLNSIEKTRTVANLQRVYTKKEVIIIYSLIKVLLSLIKEKDYIVNHTVLERLKLNDKCLISPNTISRKFGGWDNFIKYMRNKEIDLIFNEMIKQVMKREEIFPQE